jgi:hypothetical protein
MSYDKAYYERNKGKIRKYQRAWNKKNYLKFRPGKVAYKKSHPEIMRMSYYRTNAKKRGLDFLLSKDEFLRIIKMDCFYCGLPPMPMNGVDRKDNSYGYIEGNCVPCCARCNVMKMDSSVEDFLRHCIEIVHHQNKK